jgi:ATP-binding cassette, subfamily B, bacterial
VALLLAVIIDKGILTHRLGVLIALSLVTAGLAVVDVGAMYLRTWSFFTRAQTGSLVSRLNTDAVGGSAGGYIAACPTLSTVLTLAAIFALSWQISVAALVVISVFIRLLREFCDG